MKFLKYLLPCALATCGFAVGMHAEEGDGYSTVQEERETDITALSEFVKTKGAVSLLEKGGYLMLSGDIRAEWDHTRSKNHHDQHLRGKKSSYRVGDKKFPPFPTNEFNAEANLIFDYRADRTWAKLQLQFDNSCGIRRRSEKDEQDPNVTSHRRTMYGSGEVDNIAMRKAYMGYNILEQGTSRFDVELGRRRLKDVFDSKVQFHNYFDGLTFKYAQSLEAVMDFEAKVAAFVIDQNVNHFGYVGELGFLNMADFGLDFKYSFIHWDKDGVNRYNHKHPLGNRFAISQFLLAYNLPSDILSYKTQFYGAYLVNHLGHKHHWFHDKKARNAFYVGMTMGEIKRQNDWAFEIQYQWVRAQAVPESDVQGLLCRDNPRNISLYAHRDGGFANYKGYGITALYAVTDNLTMNLGFNRVHQCQKRIGGKHRAYVTSVEAIYAF